MIVKILGTDSNQRQLNKLTRNKPEKGRHTLIKTLYLLALEQRVTCILKGKNILDFCLLTIFAELLWKVKLR